MVDINFGSDASIGSGDSVSTAFTKVQNRIAVAEVNGLVPTITLSAPLSIAEGNSGTTAFSWTLTLARNGAVVPIQYTWAVTGSGTSPANSIDFVGGVFPSGSGTFGVGETTKTITVPVQGDLTVEPTENFTLTVTATMVTNTATTTGTITNDDTVGQISKMAKIGVNLKANNYYEMHRTHTNLATCSNWYRDYNSIAGDLYTDIYGNLAKMDAGSEYRKITMRPAKLATKVCVRWTQTGDEVLSYVAHRGEQGTHPATVSMISNTPAAIGGTSVGIVMWTPDPLYPDEVAELNVTFKSTSGNGKVMNLWISECDDAGVPLTTKWWHPSFVSDISKLSGFRNLDMSNSNTGGASTIYTFYPTTWAERTPKYCLRPVESYVQPTLVLGGIMFSPPPAIGAGANGPKDEVARNGLGNSNLSFAFGAAGNNIKVGINAPSGSGSVVMTGAYPNPITITITPPSTATTEKAVADYFQNNVTANWLLYTTTQLSFTGSISGNTLTVTNNSGPLIQVGAVLSANGIASGTTVTALGTGTGGVGTYTVNNSQSLGSTTITSNTSGGAPKTFPLTSLTGGTNPLHMDAWSIESLVELANDANTDFHLTLPVMTSPDFFAGAFQYCKDNLKPNLRLSIELGNEVWNTRLEYYPGWVACRAAGLAFPSGVGTDMKAAPTDIYDLESGYAWLFKRMSTIAKNIFADQPNRLVRCVSAIQQVGNVSKVYELLDRRGLSDYADVVLVADYEYSQLGDGADENIPADGNTRGGTCTGQWQSGRAYTKYQYFTDYTTNKAYYTAIAHTSTTISADVASGNIYEMAGQNLREPAFKGQELAINHAVEWADEVNKRVNDRGNMIKFGAYEGGATGFDVVFRGGVTPFSVRVVGSDIVANLNMLLLSTGSIPVVGDTVNVDSQSGVTGFGATALVKGVVKSAVADGTQITGFLTGTSGGVGTYSVNISQTVGETYFTISGAAFIGSISGTTLTVISVVSGTITFANTVLNGRTANITLAATGTPVVTANASMTYTITSHFNLMVKMLIDYTFSIEKYSASSYHASERIRRIPNSDIFYEFNYQCGTPFPNTNHNYHMKKSMWADGMNASRIQSMFDAQVGKFIGYPDKGQAPAPTIDSIGYATVPMKTTPLTFVNATPVNEWLIDGTVVGTGTTYAPTNAQIGKNVVFRQTITDAVGITASYSSLPRTVIALVKTFQILKGTTSYTIPADFNPAKPYSIEVIGAGGTGVNTVGNLYKNGGGGGAYAKEDRAGTLNLAAGDVVSVQVGAGASQLDTWFKSNTLVKAPAGTNATNVSGGKGVGGAVGTGRVTFAGGDGGTSAAYYAGAGGGGAAGPLGAGGFGKIAASGSSGGGGGGAQSGNTDATATMAGGNNALGTGGGTATGQGSPAASGKNGGGGAGANYDPANNKSVYAGGNGSTDFIAAWADYTTGNFAGVGSGSGGGRGGYVSTASGVQPTTGGIAGQFGGGSGGGSTDSVSGAYGTAGDGVIIFSYMP